MGAFVALAPVEVDGAGGSTPKSWSFEGDDVGEVVGADVGEVVGDDVGEVVGADVVTDGAFESLRTPGFTTTSGDPTHSMFITLAKSSSSLVHSRALPSLRSAPSELSYVFDSVSVSNSDRSFESL